MRSFSYETSKNPDGSYKAKVQGQDLEATGTSEQDALFALKQMVNEKFLKGNLNEDIKQTLV